MTAAEKTRQIAYALQRAWTAERQHLYNEAASWREHARKIEREYQESKAD